MAEPEEEPNIGLEAEADDHIDDADSAYGDGGGSSTTSISSSIMNYREENGRTYHSYKAGKYPLPNDETENDRLDLQHHHFTLTLGGKLCICPGLKDKPLHRILDIGTGTGIWAIDFADEHPETEVIGIDLSPIQPSFIPPNLSFEIDDVEEPWTYSKPFDFMQCRMMTGSIADWPRVFQQSFENLTPGGWMEVTDISFPIRCDDGTLIPGSALHTWSKQMLEASYNLGRYLNSAESYKRQLEDAGFVNVTEKQLMWPQNRWPKDKRWKEVGLWTMENLTSGLSGLSMFLYTRGLSMPADELEIFLVDVRKDMRDMKIHTYWPIYVVYGQKPE